MATEQSWKPDDPNKAIEDILVIVDDLYGKFVDPAEKEGKRTRYRSTGGVVDLSKPENPEAQKLKRGNSVPIRSTDQDETERYIPKLRRNLRLLKEDVVKLQDLSSEVANEVGKHITPLEKLLEKVDKAAVLTKGMKKDLEDINKKIFNLMCQVPLLPTKRGTRGGLDSVAGYEINNGKGIECLPALHANEEDLKRLAVFRRVRDQFTKLPSPNLQICLLSFAVFPENQEVNITMLMYWWIGEGILPAEFKCGGSTRSGESTPPNNVNPKKDRPEDVTKAVLDYFTELKLIEPVENKRKVEPNSYKMSPFVHWSVVLISKQIGLFDMYHKGKKPSMKRSELHKVCLVDGSSSQEEAKATKMKDDVEKIETVFNVSERFPDFTFKWFSEDQPSKNKTFSRLSKTKYKNVLVFYLGRWERTAKRHIEVENPELMKYLKRLTKLRLLSFQGISRIERLDDAVCKLHELIILDLRACYNLEKLPEKIDSLKKLVYLDITDCYMIDRMPKRLSWLDKLQVLKGFVVSDATDEEKVCLLAELKYLKNLRKLSVTINKGGDFTVAKLFLDIEGFDNLEKLKVAWGGINEHKKGENTKSEAAAEAKKSPKKLPKKLKKLDLQCFPDAELPECIRPHKLDVLEKLYIKGGTKLTGFEGLTQPDDEKTAICNVKILRLKFLPRLKVEWRDLKERYFPNLKFLEKYQCPQVSLCPTDGIGIWREDVKPEQL